MSTGGYSVFSDLGEGIVTPEAVVLELDTAGVASRAFAGAVDVGVQLIAFIVVLTLLQVAGVLTGISEGAGIAVVSIITFAIIFGYPVVWELKTRGRTLGKAMFGLRVVTIEGAPIRFRHAAVRSMGGIVDKWIPPGAMVGTFFVLGTPGRQRIGDLLAGTMVIRDPDRMALPVGYWFPVPYGWEAYAATIDPTALTVDQYGVVRAFLMRCRELTPAARHTLALDLADRVAAALNHQRPAAADPEAFLLCVIARYQRRNFAGYQPSTT